MVEITRMSFFGNSNIGIYAFANDKVLILPPGIGEYDVREVNRVLVDSLEKVLKSRRIADWGPNFECARELVWGASSRVLDDLYMRIVLKYGSIDNFFSRLRGEYGSK